MGAKKTLQYVFLYLFRFTDPLSKRLHSLHQDKRWHEKAFTFKKVLNEKNTIQHNSDYSDRISSYFNSYGIKVDDSWHYIFRYANKIESVKYIPEHLFSIHIEPYYNNLMMTKAYGDKNIYGRLFHEIEHPETVLRYINGLYYDENYKAVSRSNVSGFLKSHQESLIIKPSLHSGGSKNIHLLHISDNQMYLDTDRITVSDLEEDYQSGFIIQKRIEQYENISNIYHHSVNTLKIMTFRFAGEIHLLSAIIRFGNKGNFVDNMQAGGFSCAINNEGYVNDFGIDYNLNKYKEHPLNKTQFANLKIPNYKDLIDRLKIMHEQLHYFGIISWDIAIGKTGTPILVEYNLRYQSIVLHQLNNGPLFGDFTDSILEDISNNSG